MKLKEPHASTEGSVGVKFRLKPLSSFLIQTNEGISYGYWFPNESLVIE